MSVAPSVKFELTSLDDDLEPLTRSRSNTWPSLPKLDARTANDSMEREAAAKSKREDPLSGSDKKKPTRKNAWGSLSYAELIGQAINAAKDKRLTLSQIYDWMVENVAYFKDKGGSNSSAGWKNSIRHNLSLHNRFVRVPNAGIAKSSWWTINPDQSAAKSTRRRTASMEAGRSVERKRGRARMTADLIKRKRFKPNPGEVEWQPVHACDAILRMGQSAVSYAPAVDWQAAYPSATQRAEQNISMSREQENSQFATSTMQMLNTFCSTPAAQALGSSPYTVMDVKYTTHEVFAQMQNTTSHQALQKTDSFEFHLMSRALLGEEAGCAPLVKSNSMLSDIAEIVSRELRAADNSNTAACNNNSYACDADLSLDFQL